VSLALSSESQLSTLRSRKEVPLVDQVVLEQPTLARLLCPRCFCGEIKARELGKKFAMT
jgi:hypothetical protein